VVVISECNIIEIVLFKKREAVMEIIVNLLGNTSKAKELNRMPIIRTNRAMGEVAGVNIPSPKWSLV